MASDRDRMIFEGVVTDDNKGKFTVEVNPNYRVLCTLSGKIRQNSVRILVGDSVRVEVSEYDTTQGRIVFRLKNQVTMTDNYHNEASVSYESRTDLLKAMLPGAIERSQNIENDNYVVLHFDKNEQIIGVQIREFSGASQSYWKQYEDLIPQSLYFAVQKWIGE